MELQKRYEFETLIAIEAVFCSDHDSYDVEKRKSDFCCTLETGDSSVSTILNVLRFVERQTRSVRHG